MNIKIDLASLQLSSVVLTPLRKECLNKNSMKSQQGIQRKTSKSFDVISNLDI